MTKWGEKNNTFGNRTTTKYVNQSFVKNNCAPLRFVPNILLVPSVWGVCLRHKMAGNCTRALSRATCVITPMFGLLLEYVGIPSVEVPGGVRKSHLKLQYPFRTKY